MYGPFDFNKTAFFLKLTKKDWKMSFDSYNIAEINDLKYIEARRTYHVRSENG